MRQEHPTRMNVEQHQFLPTDSEQLYILLDGAQIDAMVFAYTHDDSPVVQQLYAGTRHSSAIEVSPCLIKPSATTRLWEAQNEWCSYGVVVKSEASLMELADHLRSLISVRLPSQQLAYCRYYAPEWTARLLQSFTDAELQAFSGPIQRWSIYEPSQWLSISVETTGLTRRSDEEGWLSLSQQQLDLFQADEQKRFIERMANHFGCQSAATREGSNAREQLSQLARQAQRLGFTQEHQCTHYMELAWRFPEAIRGPELEALLANQNLPTNERLNHAENRLFGLA